MSVKPKYHKVRIIPKKGGFHDDIIDFLKRKSTYFKRETSLLEILENKNLLDKIFRKRPKHK